MQLSRIRGIKRLLPNSSILNHEESHREECKIGFMINSYSTGTCELVHLS